MSIRKDSSKTLSYILRHKPESVNIKLDRYGYANVDDILIVLNIKKNELEELVETSDKQRFAFNNDKTKIRASQGHSIKVDLQLVKTIPPTILYHGTHKPALDSIMSKGLNKMARHHVHLSKDIPTAKIVAARRSNPIILEIDSKAMFTDNFEFFISDNGVYLVDEVPAKYIKLIL